jgi:site-specific DNA recombinase
MRFAFYGRVSTEDQRDPQASKGWQLSRARSLIAPACGEIVEEFFDIGTSHALPWKRRPEALRLLDALKNPLRGFQAVVVGEPQRAFYGNQFGMTFPVFVHYGVQLWVPEVGGAIDPGSDAHDLVMALYGGMSKGERNRIKIRVRSAMKAQTEIEGRFLGGRPSYGYRLADAGPHPNPAKAAQGTQLHRLEPDPITAPIVQRILSEYVAGRGMTTIARGLTNDGIACPSAYDRKRNPHRHNAVWETTAVRAILLNPRYTGRQVWNKQRTDRQVAERDAGRPDNEQLKRTLAECDAKLTAKPTRNVRMSEEQISAIVHGLGGLLGLLCHADPSEKAEICSRLGLQLTYRPGAQTLIAEVTTSAIDGVNNVCPEGDSNTCTKHPCLRTVLMRP